MVKKKEPTKARIEKLRKKRDAYEAEYKLFMEDYKVSSSYVGGILKKSTEENQ